MHAVRSVLEGPPIDDRQNERKKERQTERKKKKERE
jgi:hypothetical protein